MKIGMSLLPVRAGYWRKRLCERVVVISIFSYGLLSCGTDSEARNVTQLQEETDSDLFAERANEGPQMKTLVETVLKVSPVDSVDLGRTDKCHLSAGQILRLTKPAEGWGRHWKIQLKEEVAGCSIKQGFLFDEHVVLSGGSRGSYTLPLPGSFITSDWCVCRSVGTSPHIGLDLAKGGAMRSVALSAGQVDDVVYVPSCGWEVRLRDNGGALWSYLHLDRPSVARGQTVEAGALIGRHESYPQSGCGTGPHLHLERLSAGSFGDQASGRSCQGVFRSCNFDPRRAFPGAFAVSAEHQQNLSELPRVKESQKGESCSPYQPAPQPVTLKIEADFGAENLSSGGLLLDADMSETSSSSGRQILTWNIAVKLANEESLVNKNNSCHSDVFGLEEGCVASYELYIEDANGRVVRLATDQDARGQRLSMVAEARYCSPLQGARRYGLRARLGSGELLTKWGKVERSK